MTLQGGARNLERSGPDLVRQNDPRPQFTNRGQRFLSVGGAWYFSDYVGVSTSLFGGWEVIAEREEYMSRALGVALGARTRLWRKRLVVGWDFQRSHVAYNDSRASAWAFGSNVSVMLNLTVR